MSEPVFYLQYEVRPLPGSPIWKEAGGAFVHCYVRATDSESARRRADRALAEEHWELVSLEDEPRAVRREFLADEDARRCFDAAQSEGEALLYHMWPPEPQEDDHVH